MRNINKGSSLFLDRLSTGCKTIDDLLGGGVPYSGISEIAGESGSGKSQLCMQLSLTVQYPKEHGGMNGSTLFICTEERFQSKRLQQMIEEFPKQYYKNCDIDVQFSDNIFIEHVADFTGLLQSLSKRVPVLLERKNIKLLIIDSIAAIFRGTYEQNEGQKRAMDMRQIGSLLHKLCFQKDLMVITVNQVTDSFEDGSAIPSLGLAWANIVTRRFQTSKCPDGGRKFQVCFAPEVGQGMAYYSIQACGITNV